MKIKPSSSPSNFGLKGGVVTKLSMLLLLGTFAASSSQAGTTKTTTTTTKSIDVNNAQQSGTDLSNSVNPVQVESQKIGNSRSNRRGSTGASGKTGNSRKKDVNIDPNKGRHIYGLKWSERSDKPCYIDVFTGQFVKGKFDPVTGRDGEAQSECEKKGMSMKTINFGSPSGTSYWAVDGVKVCLNSKETRLKGITLYATKVESGDLTSNFNSKTEKRTNCSKWQAKKSCPTGQIASELTFYYEDGAIKAINLDCSDYYWE